MAKRLGSRYQPVVESNLWLKQRFNQEDKFFFVSGYIPGTKGVGELLIGGIPRNNKLYYVKRDCRTQRL
jgi:ATP-dependent DNA ligase